MTADDSQPRAPLPVPSGPSRARVLCVDDEPNLLEGLRRHVGRVHELVLVQSGAEGLAKLRDAGPFDAVVSDMRMPGMDGATFLAQVRELAPDSVRILLTGQTDLESAAAAINTGRIHRFLTKPCTSQVILAALDSGFEEQRRARVERELLENTLKGSIRLLADITGMLSPATFGRASRLQSYVMRMCEELDLRDRWEVEIAAMLSQIGCLLVPTELLARAEAGGQPTDAERKLLDSHPRVAAQWIATIPRLERVAAMVERQGDAWDALKAAQPPLDELVVLGAQMLHLAREIDRLVLASHVAAGGGHATLDALKRKRGGLHPRLLEILDRLQPSVSGRVSRSVFLRELGPGMLLEQDVRTVNGQLVVPRGQDVTHSVIQRLANFAQSVGIEEPVRVSVLAVESA